MGLKFTLTASIFQLLLIVLFAVLVDYSKHALPPHKHEGASGTGQNASNVISNDIAIYYPSKDDFLIITAQAFPMIIYTKSRASYRLHMNCITRRHEESLALKNSNH